MVEVTLALVLLAGAGVLVRSSRAAFQVDLGFDAEHLTRLSLLSGKSGWASAEEMERYYTAVRERLATVPGVEAAAVVHAPPIANTGWVMATFPESEPPEGGKLPPLAWWRPVSPHYFQTAGIRLLADRGFGDEDRLAAEPVVVLNETLARAYLPPGASLDEALSATWRITFEGEERMRVVGVVGDVRILGPRQQAPRIAYRPLAQASQTLFRYGITDARSFLVRSHLPPAALAAPLRAAALAEDRLASVLQLESMSRTLRTSQARSTAVTTLLTSFALTALLLGAVGIYGVMSHAVGERRREMGIRLALGARPAAVLGAVLRDGLGLVLAGLSLGALCALGATRLLQSELFTVAPNDPTSLLTAGTVLLLSGTIAVLVPARRASRVDPIEVLRND